MTLLVIIPGEVRPAERTGAGEPPSRLRRVSAWGLLGVLLVLSLLSTEAGAQDTITLRSVVHVQPGSSLTIADVADTDAQDTAFMSLSLPARRIGGHITASDLREVLEKARGVNLGRLRIRGGPCEIREAPRRSRQVAQAEPEMPRSSNAPRVRDVIPLHLSRLFSASPDDIRVVFDETDANLLNTPISERTLSVHPLGGGVRVPLEVRIFENDRLVLSGRVLAEVLVRREVFEAATLIPRGTVLSEDKVRRTTRWMAVPESPADAGSLGQVVRTRIEPGEIIRARDVESPVIVKRGEIISVDCIAGGVLVRTSARATQPARNGDVITLQALNSKRTFQARISGPGQAVLVLGKEPNP
jgi:flagella basal body P-ring formation protein FlgA